FPFLRGYTYAKCGRRAQALAELDRLGAEARQGRFVSHLALAIIHAGLGDKERALAELDSAYLERAWGMFTLRVDPTFDGLRADPRFGRLLKKVGSTLSVNIPDRKSTRLNSSHVEISYAVFCLK